MTTISRQLRVPYSAPQMYALVNDVARYPEFVPWCTKATVYTHTPSHMRAGIEVDWHGVTQRFTTENQLNPNEAITMRLVEGGIKDLLGAWRFKDLGDHCQVELTVTITFHNRLLALVFTKVADKVLTKMCDAFCARAKVLYG